MKINFSKQHPQITPEIAGKVIRILKRRLQRPDSKLTNYNDEDELLVTGQSIQKQLQVSNFELEYINHILKRIVPNCTDEIQMLQEFEKVLIDMISFNREHRQTTQTSEESKNYHLSYPKYQKYTQKHHFLHRDKLFNDQSEIVKRQCASDLYYKQRQRVQKKEFLKTVENKLKEKVEGVHKSFEAWKLKKVKDGEIFDEFKDQIFIRKMQHAEFLDLEADKTLTYDQYLKIKKH